ncbi:hypothetical protein [Qipengyuania aquimaris]|uniref:hypothetical protein n=1 Tax=Qipengyuania aquimaris TaxID=255984 RepID=UPI001FD24B77|nr:hypothetical protein [Qipengyuania aquimaris]UOR14463.1 hypothetical protein LCM05_08100 [Qipengyuania aquimaris]
MRKLTLVALPTALTLAAFNPALAQDDGSTDTDAGTDTAEPTGAVVTREALTEEREVVDDEGNPVLDADGNPTFETVETGWVQTVETPSGNTHTITKVEGERAVVTHEKAERVARAERPAKADRPDKPERPEKPEKPEKPERPDRPGRGG